MKKIILVFFMLLSVITISSCSLKKYDEYAGVYELYHMSGDLKLSMYEYYKITLNGNGSCVVESKGANSSQSYEAKGTFDIEGEEIKIYTKNGTTKITETYDYINGEIHMINQTISGYTFTAKFKRNLIVI